MLTLVVPEAEYWDEENEEFALKPEVKLEMVHSLVTISKWESIHEKPFISDEQKTTDEVLSYIQCMTLSENVDPEVYSRLSDDNVQEVSSYIESKQTATWFSAPPNPGAREIITSEVIYYWMITLGIPTEFQHWHLSRLLTLIKVCEEKNNSNKPKMSQSEIMARNHKLNEARKVSLGTKG